MAGVVVGGDDGGEAGGRREESRRALPRGMVERDMAGSVSTIEETGKGAR